MKNNILIVDDNIENLNLLIKILEQEEYNIRPAKNCKIALQTLEKELPDIILMDIMLPDMNGYEACRIIKEDINYKNIPIIFISALDQPFDKIKAFLLGAVDYITKPFNIEEVKIRIKTHLKIINYQKELEKSNNELKLFASFISHDLRAPLRHIMSFSELLLGSIQNSIDNEQKKYLNNIITSTKNMSVLIDDLLNLTKIDKNRLNFVEVNLNIIIENSIDLLSEEIKNRKIKWKISKFPLIYADHSLMREVIINLISNAVKYTKNRLDAEIEIGFYEELDKITIFVKDNGAGFDLDYSNKLFIPFQRLHSKNEFEGNGIGLALVKKIINMHNGLIWADGKLNEGAAFYFSIPKKINYE